MENIKTVIIHGQNHKGSTYHIAHELAEKISDIKKKVLPIILSLSLGLSLAACGKNNNTDDEKGTAEIGSEETYVSQDDTSLDATEEVTEDTGSLNDYKYMQYADMTAEEIVNSLTLEQKAFQMVQPACYMTSLKAMKENCYGSVLSRDNYYNYEQWQEYIDNFQQMAISSEAGVPFIYGQDDVHGVNYAVDTVIFPHNIGMGAANDEELMYQVGLITADEAKLCHMLWNFSPCVAQSVDPRWGRTYESYGSDIETITKLSTAYTKGVQDGGVIACTKHFFADGNVLYGTGEDSDADRIIDRGDAVLTDEQIDELLSVYKAQIDAGVKTIMISHSSLNGVKMHENKEYIDILKNDYGFEGFIVSDWNSVQNTSPETYYEQVVTAVNSGIDMLMEVDRYDEAAGIVVEAVGNGDISEERVDDAVRRIIQVKKDIGIIKDPFCDNMETVQDETGSGEYRAVAERAVEESLVLIKNEGEVLPFKSGTSVYIMGPAANNDVSQCGGWTMDWNESYLEDIPGLTTIREGFEQKADEYGINVITKEADAENADVILLVVGEQAYAEWNGDAEDIDLCGPLGLSGNASSIEKAKKYGKPIVTCIVAGRNVFIDDYIDDWDGVVMCYLPGSEGQGVANVLCGNSNFTGRLPSPWYSSVEQIESGNAWLERGYGLTY
ncbi:MAG: glycoside hydrolase family 3 protein [Lachnospiraceae bacterium]|nr:glycoside hydrolase family 3 protein [Lachnospiraceae bacterium]MBQ9234442.1 glycoside hydrolase family 3 protein [Lachnospiraceae bacterium]